MSEIGDKDKIAVLLTEYNTLRAEAQHRLTVLIQCSTIAVTILIALAGLAITRPDTEGIYYILLIVVMMYACVFWLVDLNLLEETKRIRELERRVNDIAGERLLIWETDFGWGGAWPRSRKTLRKLDGIDV